jgi:hypothetical protein
MLKLPFTLTRKELQQSIDTRLSHAHKLTHIVWYHVLSVPIIAMDPQLVLFRRQYLQLFEPDFLAWPPKSLLRDAGVQQWLYKHCFDTDNNPHLPSDRYRLRVLKPLVRKVEQAIEDPEEDVGYLMSLKSLSFFSFFSLLSSVFCTTLGYLVLILLSLSRRFPMISCLAFPLS